MPSIKIIYAEKFIGVVNRTRMNMPYIMRGLCERVDRAHLQQTTKEVFEVVRKFTGKKATTL